MKQPAEMTMSESGSTVETSLSGRIDGEVVAPIGDRLTGALPGGEREGRKRWARALNREAARIARGGGWASVVVIELDGPPDLLDWLESADAAQAIPALTETIRRQARGADVVVPLATGRLGVLLVDTDQVLAINFVERVREVCEPWSAKQALTLRVAIGWADARPGRSVHEALAEAEAALVRDRQASWWSPSER